MQLLKPLKPCLLLLSLLAASCQKAGDIAPEATGTTEEFEVETQGRNRDCGIAQLHAKDPAGIARALGLATVSATYVALKLDTALWVRQNQTLLVRVRQPVSSEQVVCTARGPGYPLLVVTSVRVR